MSSCHSDHAALYRFKWRLFDRSCASVWGCQCVHACWFRWHKCRPHKEIISSINTWLLYAWPAFITIILLFVHCLLWCVCGTNRVSQNVTKVRSERFRLGLSGTNNLTWTTSLIDNSLYSDWMNSLICHPCKPKPWSRPMRGNLLFR